MTYRIAFFDIDGTILRPDNTYEESTKTAIHALQNQDIHVVLATGRPLHELDELAAALQVTSFIGYNGSYASFQQEKIIHEPMQLNITKKLLKAARDHNDELLFYTSSTNHFSTLDSKYAKQFMDTFQLRKNGLIEENMLDQVLSVSIVHVTGSSPAHFEVDPSLRLAPVNTEGIENSYDVILSQVNKGAAVKQMLERLNIPTEAAIAFGDGMNDKEMLETVGTGFAMGNAHPDLKKAAKFETTSVENNGIYNGLKQIGLV